MIMTITKISNLNLMTYFSFHGSLLGLDDGCTVGISLLKVLSYRIHLVCMYVLYICMYACNVCVYVWVCMYLTVCNVLQECHPGAYRADVRICNFRHQNNPLV